MLFVPGGALRGTVVDEPVTDWSFVRECAIDVETRPADPYSVEVGCVVRGGKLYIDPAEGRRWLDHIRADPRVRVRIDGEIHLPRAVLVGRPGELAGFPEDRFVCRRDGC